MALKKVVSSTPGHEKVHFSNREIKKESRKISIPFLSIPEETREKNNFEYILQLTIEQFYEKAFENKGKDNFIPDELDNILNKTKDLPGIITGKMLSQGYKIKNIEGIEVDTGYLKIQYVGENSEPDIVSFDLSSQGVDELFINQQTHDELQNEREGLFHIKYVTLAGATFTLLYKPLIVETADELDRNGKGRLTQLRFSSNGIERIIDLNQVINNNFGGADILKILESKGVQLNPKTLQFEFIETTETVKYAELKSQLKAYTYKEYLKDMQKMGMQKVSRFRFFQMKNQALEQLREINAEYNQNTNKSFGRLFRNKFASGVFEKIGGKSLHYLMLPIFFREIHKQSGNLDSYLKAGVEVVSFLTGAHYGSKIPGHPMLKMVSGLVGGGMAAVGAHEGLKKVDRHVLKYMPNREDYWERKGAGGTKSTITHFVSTFGTYDLLDLLNWDFDFSPIDITNNVHLGVHPEEYMNHRLLGVDHYNKEVDEFKLKLKKKIYELFDQKYAGTDQEKLESELIAMLGTPEYPEFENHILKEIRSRLIMFLKNLYKNHKDGQVLKKDVLDIVDYEVDKIKINQRFISEYNKELMLQGELISLALDGVLGDTGEYKIYSNGKVSVVPHVDDIGLQYRTVNEPVDDLLYITSLPENDRRFIKQVVFQGLMNPSRNHIVRIHEHKLRWNRLIQDERFYKFYNRMVKQRRQSKFIQGITRKMKGDLPSNISLGKEKRYDENVVLKRFTKGLEYTWGDKKAFIYLDKDGKLEAIQVGKKKFIPEIEWFPDMLDTKLDGTSPYPYVYINKDTPELYFDRWTKEGSAAFSAPQKFTIQEIFEKCEMQDSITLEKNYALMFDLELKLKK